MRLPPVEQAAASSRALLYALKRDTIASSASGGEAVYSHRFRVGPAHAAIPWVSVSVFGGEDKRALTNNTRWEGDRGGGAAEELRIAVYDARGQLVRPSRVVEGQRLGIGANSHGYSGAIFANPAPGEWRLQVTAAAGAPRSIMALVTIGGDTLLWSSLATHRFIVGEPVPVVATLLGPHPSSAYRSDGDGTLPMAHEAAEGEEECRIVVEEPDGSTQSHAMRRQPLPSSHYLARAHGQAEAFQTTLATTRPGLYTVKIESSGRAGVRHAFHTFRVVARRLQVLEGAATAELLPRPAHCAALVREELEAGAGDAVLSLVDTVASHSIVFGVPVRHEAGGGRYRVYAEVWASAGGAVGWVSRMVSVPAGESTVRLTLDVRWLLRARSATSPLQLTLRQLRFEDAANFVPVVSRAGREQAVAVVWASLAARHALEQLASGRAQLAPSAAVSQTMREGCPPLRRSPSSSAQNSSFRVEAGRIALVHGYCADANPFGTAGWTSFSVFADYEQSRPMDDFAQRIGAHLVATDSVSIAAHSMGGMAALHLLTYYHSNLDLGSGGHAIQSVGTPYQGCPLAGLLAAIGDFFGYGCGMNDDLTYDGAQRWLAGIPASSRAAVYYYFTWYDDTGGFPYLRNYCSLAANAVLSWPNDGVVEVTRAVLPSGNLVSSNMGECHVDGMLYPNQCSNLARNVAIDAAAAR